MNKQICNDLEVNFQKKKLKGFFAQQTFLNGVPDHYISIYSSERELQLGLFLIILWQILY